MAKKNRIPKVRMAQPKGRPIQLRYFDQSEGREIRITTKTYNVNEALEEKKKLEAKLLLGMDAKPKATKQHGPRMSWDDFRDEYRRLYLEQDCRPKSIIDSDSRLDVAERIIKPTTIGDMATRENLERLQAALLEGVESRFDPPRPRSAHSVRSHMATVLAALNWAVSRDWLPAVPKIRKVKTAKIRAAKGRPITLEEFERMLDIVPKVVGDVAAPSWLYLLRGLWESALRLDELMHVSWDDRNAICPEWPKRRLPVLSIPSTMQKNNTEESIPLLPGFEALLLETPLDDRTGWVFRPESLQMKEGRKPRHDRPDAEWVGKIISRIGKEAGVVVHPGDKSRSRPAKFCSAHDLRRSCGERLIDADVPATVVTRVLRHASFETTRRHYCPGDVQKDAKKLREKMSLPAVPGYNQLAEST